MRSLVRSPVRGLAALGLAGVLAATGCSSSTGNGLAQREPTREPTTAASTDAAGVPEFDRYVALGDSYTSAPYVGNTDLAQGCLRSAANYPRLFAAQHEIGELVDVSCAGATTRDLGAGQHPFHGEVQVPPQFAALTRDTDLVTVGIGGNDQDLFGQVAAACTRGAPSGRMSCAQAAATDVRPIGDNVEAALREVRRLAPDAAVVLVGYPRILEGRRCPSRLPVAPDGVAALTGLSQRLDAQLRRAARAAGVDYLDVYAASEGHGVCSAQPWVNGAHSAPGRAAALHPFAVEQQAVADLLARALTR